MLAFSTYLNQWIDRFLIPIDDPTSRLFHLNLVFCVGFVFIWAVVLKKRSSKKVFRWRYIKLLFFSKNYWWNSSTRFDYQIYALNSLLKVFIFIPFLDVTFRISMFVIGLLQKTVPDHQALPVTSFNLFLFTLAFFVLDDFIRFIHHFGMHRIPWLWKFHCTHHSATTLTPITLYRTHPVESAIATIRNSLSLGIATGAFVFLFQSQLTMTTLLGINFFGFTFNLLGSNLRHSHIDFTFGPLERIFISPKQHQIHHSTNPEHFDRNFGVSLSVWDQLFKTYTSASNVKKLRFGLG
ncbi:MAG: sterol desaturase family protein [Pseudobdellovibrio sp.]|nr:sterol desaturase family protein [Pseudobdellovibrio sp.]